MPRIRSIHPDAWKSEKLALASDGAERCYWRIQPYMDDQGREEDHPKLIAATVFPLRDAVTEAVVEAWLVELAGLGLVVRYTVDGLRLLQIVRWSNYQHPQRPKQSDFPPPPAHSGTGTRHVGDTQTTGTLRRGVERMGEEGESEGEDPAPSPNGVPVENPNHPLARRALHAIPGVGQAS